MSRIPPVDPAEGPAELREIFAQQTEQWGAPLGPTLVMAHCPPLVQVFCPLTTSWSPASSANICSAAKSDPAPGSE